MKRKTIVSLFCFVLIAGLIAAFLLFILPPKLQYWDSIRKLTFIPYEYQETNAYLDSPYCGFYHIYGYILKNEVSYNSIEEVPNVQYRGISKTEERLVQLQFNMHRFSNEPIPDLALQQLDMILDAWSRTGYSFILRFLYDWDGYGKDAEPDNIEQLMQHMEQVAQVYNKYADYVFMIQGFSTGNTGEMHNTNYGGAEHLKILGSKLAEVSDPSIYLSVRTPFQWRCVTGVDNYAELAALPDSPFLGRLGLFNDGMFGTEADTGTYIDRSRAEELAFQNELCKTVPNGGEAIIDNPFNDLENAIRDMRVMHVSYLNSVHDPAVMTKWKESVYHGDDVFDGLSGFEYIRRHLGYRYVIRSAELSEYSEQGQDAKLLLSIENVGFSVSYRDFSFALTMVNAETGETYALIPDYTVNDLQSGETSVWEIPVDGAFYAPGIYQLYWQTTDTTFGEVIEYGNILPLTEYGYPLGTLLIDAPYRINLPEK